MREDFQEKLDGMFPEGFLILYPTKAHPESFRMLLVADKETPYCEELSAAWELLRKAENNGKSRA